MFRRVDNEIRSVADLYLPGADVFEYWSTSKLKHTYYYYKAKLLQLKVLPNYKNFPSLFFATVEDYKTWVIMKMDKIKAELRYRKVW